MKHFCTLLSFSHVQYVLKSYFDLRYVLKYFDLTVVKAVHRHVLHMYYFVCLLIKICKRSCKDFTVLIFKLRMFWEKLQFSQTFFFYLQVLLAQYVIERENSQKNTSAQIVFGDKAGKINVLGVD